MSDEHEGRPGERGHLSRIDHPGLKRSSADAEAWETSPDELSDMTLMEILNDPTVRGCLDVSEEARQQIRLHEAPPGFRALMGKLADELFVSYSGLSRVTLGHGLAILEAKPWIEHLRSAYEHVRREGMDKGDPDALARLNLTARYSFRQSRPVATTLDASRATAARISDLAMVCGVPRAVIAVVAIALSLLTLKNNRGYRALLEAEVDAFRRYVIRRTKELRLGDVP